MIGGKPFWLWRTVDSEGEVLDLLVQRRRYDISSLYQIALSAFARRKDANYVIMRVASAMFRFR